jgi:DNA-binding SARP family transcriptional activator
METLHVQLFGGPRLFRGKEEIPLSPHQTGLLGMLFGTDEPALARVDALAYLWPDEEPRSARRRLTQLLYSLRKKIGEPGAFEVQREEIRKLPAGVSTDLEAYATALQNCAFQTCSVLLQKGFASRAVGSVNRQHTANPFRGGWQPC